MEVLVVPLLDTPRSCIDGELFNQLVQIYHRYNMHDLQDNNLPMLSVLIPIIVCSQALV